VFSTELLKTALMRDHQIKDSSHDFGKDVLPLLVQDQKVYAYNSAEIKVGSPLIDTGGMLAQ
jgi:glucose-1-phosphate adenylyltransferase